MYIDQNSTTSTNIIICDYQVKSSIFMKQMLKLLYGAVELSGFKIPSGQTADSGLACIEDFICEWQSVNRRKE